MKRDYKDKLVHSRRHRQCYNMSSSKRLLAAMYQKDSISTIRATSWGQFQVHPDSRMASLMKSEGIVKEFIKTGSLPVELDERLLSNWIIGSGRFRRLVKEGYSTLKASCFAKDDF